jgi:hypothetical protein
MQLGRDAFRRGRPEVSAAGRGGDLTELLRACLPALQVPEEQAVALRPRTPQLWPASDALGQFARLLASLPDGSPLTAFLPPIPEDAPSRTLRCRAAVASTLIAGLERARDGALLLEQEALDAHPGQPPGGRRSCRRCFCVTFLTERVVTIGFAANFDDASGHARGKACFHARGGNMSRCARELRAPGWADIPGSRHPSRNFEQIERCDHKRESPAVDDWDAPKMK